MLSALLKPLHTKEKTQVLEAINTLRFKVTPENISLSTSLPVATAAQQLNIIAAETSAHLKVDSTGALLYEFAPGFERAYLFDITKQLFSANGNFFLRALRVAFRLALGVSVLLIKISIALISFLFRAMFGILLIGSIIAIVVGIMAAIAAVLDGAGDGIDIGGAGDGIGGLATSGLGNINFDFSYVTYDFIRLLDWTYYWGDPGYGYRSYGYSYDYYHAGNIGAAQNSSSERFASSEKVEKGDFVTNCFSYLFGDGHPNADLKERYWHQIGLVIKRNHGVVVAEQLAPYAGDTSGTEDWMLPILVHFNGTPEVSDIGNILYIFPTFVREDIYTPSTLSLQPQTNANSGDPLRDLYRSHLKRQADQSWTGATTNAHSQLSRFLEERRWEFSLQSVDSAFKIGTITLVNLVGSIWLYNATFTMRILQPFHQISLYMVAYAVFLIALPAFRFLWIMMLNLGIDKRNAMRSSFATALSAPSAELRTKISEASVHINQLLLAPKPSIVFTTEEDSLAQQFIAQPTFQHSRNFSR